MNIVKMNLSPEHRFSTKLSEALDMIGFSLQTVRTSQLLAGHLQRAFNRYEEKLVHIIGQNPFQIYLVGSKSEGMCFLQTTSDMDLMYVDYSNRCSIAPSVGSHYRYKICLENCPPGYCMLRTTHESDYDPVKNTLIDENAYLPSDSSSLIKNYGAIMNVSGPTVKYIDAWMYKLFQTVIDQYVHCGRDSYQIQRTGPSTEFSQDSSISADRMCYDNVRAYPANVNTYFKLWCDRKRLYGFPSRRQIEEISKMDAHVVPVGCKYTENPGLQWRICFTFGEVALIHSFNGTQYKVYALLKMLSKSVLKPVCPAITSYVMKNVLLWISELYHPSLFQETNIPQCLIICLQFLRKCVRGRYVPNYMIPTRDLLYGKLKDKTVRKLDILIGELLSEGGNMVLRCEGVRLALHMVIKLPLILRPKEDTGVLLTLLLFHMTSLHENISINSHSDSLLSVFELFIYIIERYSHLASSHMKGVMMRIVKEGKGNLMKLQSYSKYRKQTATIRALLTRYEHMEEAVLESLLLDTQPIVMKLCTEKLMEISATNGQDETEFLQYTAPVAYMVIQNMFLDQNYKEFFKNIVSSTNEQMAFGSEKEKHELINALANSFHFSSLMTDILPSSMKIY